MPTMQIYRKIFSLSSYAKIKHLKFISAVIMKNYILVNICLDKKLIKFENYEYSFSLLQGVFSLFDSIHYLFENDIKIIC